MILIMLSDSSSARYMQGESCLSRAVCSERSSIKWFEHSKILTCHVQVHQWMKQNQRETQQTLLLHAALLAMLCSLQHSNTDRPVWSCEAPCFEAFLAWRFCTHKKASVHYLATTRSGPLMLILLSLIFNCAHFSTRNQSCWRLWSAESCW